MTRVAQTAEACGYESVWLSDHFMPLVPHPSPEENMWFECWTSTAALARDTKRVRIGQYVTCNGYRNPALLAKMASTVDVLSHGRLILGIGAGDYEQEFRAYGYAYPEVPERLRQLREAVQVLLAMWTQEEVTFEGTYYQVRGAINQPKGVQHPHIPLMIGGTGEKVTLKLAAHYSDICDVLTGDPATIEHKFAVLKAHCEAVGRDYQSIRRAAQTICVIGETDEQARARLTSTSQAHLRTAIDKPPPSQRKVIEGMITSALIGGPDTIRQRLAALEAAGVQELRLIFYPGMLDLDSLRFFAQEFITSV